MKQLRFAAALAIIIAAIAVPTTALAGEWCVFDDGTHVHTSCGNYSDDEYNNRHSHDDGDAHAHPTHEFSEGNARQVGRSSGNYKDSATNKSRVSLK